MPTEDHIEPDTAQAPEPSGSGTAATESPAPPLRWTVAVQPGAILRAATILVLVAVVAVTVGLWLADRHQLASLRAAGSDDQHAEQVATRYALGASSIDYQDVNAWVTKLKSNTTPELAAKFDATAPKLQEILLPLKWTSTAAPIAAKVVSKSGGTDKVDVFVNVTSTNAQNPESSQMTVTYTVTVDPGSDWKITDVGGLDGALPTK